MNASGPNERGKIVVEVEALAKRFRIFPNDRQRLAEVVWGGRRHTEFWALRDVTFDVPRATAFGVIGPNGAGKSTLLKILSGVSPPTAGRVEIRGTLNSLLDLGVGFHPDFTGRQNTLLNCRLLGMDDAEIQDRLPLIIDFAEIGEFFDLPVRTYSSGMSLRLGFAIAAHLGHEILLIDELLTVGDAYFQRKCIGRIESFIAEGRTLILVSHDLHAVRELCDKAIWVDEGRLQASGDARHVVDAYVDQVRGRKLPVGALGTSQRLGALEDEEEESVDRRVKYRATTPDPALKRSVVRATYVPDAEAVRKGEDPTQSVELGDPDNPVVTGSGEVEFLAVQLLNGDGKMAEEVPSFAPLTVAVTFRTLKPVTDPILGVAIFRNDGVYVFGPNTRFDKVEQMKGVYDGVYSYFIHYPKLPLLEGTYRLSVAAYDKNHIKPHIWHNQLYELKVRSALEDHGLVHIDHQWGLVTHACGDGEKLP
ncbi:MAG: ABC transporter ATP-binding protein [Myxococcota bacterium]|nr:ABC transporter ATP-binding protein [Myxococcota bacterium]